MAMGLGYGIRREGIFRGVKVLTSSKHDNTNIVHSRVFEGGECGHNASGDAHSETEIEDEGWVIVRNAWPEQ